jgi:hypothetical protein
VRERGEDRGEKVDREEGTNSVSARSEGCRGRKRVQGEVEREYAPSSSKSNGLVLSISSLELESGRDGGDRLSGREASEGEDGEGGGEHLD